LILSLLLSSCTASAASVGEHTSSTWYETITDSDGNTIWFQIHYPSTHPEYGAEADPSRGPFPVVGFMHGYLGQAWMYQSACDAIASMGFVVVNMDTETHAWMDPYLLADYTQTAMEWVDARSADPDHWLHGMADPDAPWAVMGHSMGGIAVASLADQSPRVDLAVGFAPYRDADYLWDAYADFDGAALMIGGDQDETSTPDIVSDWLADIDAPTRGLFTLVDGAGHQAVTDIEFEEADLSEAEQLSVNIDLAASFLQAERFGDEQAYDGLVCAPPAPLAGLEARGTTPATAAVASTDTDVRVSLVGAAGDVVALYGGLGPGRGTTPDGVVGIGSPVELTRISLPDGATCVELALPPELAGAAWVQAVHVREGGNVFARIIDVFGTGGVPAGSGDTGARDTADDGWGDDLPADDTGDSGGGCGCDTGAGGAGAAWVGLAALAALRRGRR
jgi:dienelactone hydrolase